MYFLLKPGDIPASYVSLPELVPKNIPKKSFRLDEVLHARRLLQAPNSFHPKKGICVDEQKTHS